MSVADAIDRCTAITRTHSRTFSLGSRLFPKTQRHAVSVVYAACRTGDDAVDEAPSADEGRRRLDAWRAGIERAYRGHPRDDAATEIALAWALERYDIPLAAFRELHAGLAFDIDMSSISDWDELMTYCRRVAGVVGLMIAPIAGYDGGDDTLDRAVELGQAMQVTNILRDVGEDLARGRCYLPASWMTSYGVSLADLYRGEITPGYAELLEALSRKAHELYRSGWAGIPRLHGTAPAAVALAALNYEGILHKVEQNRWDNLTRRAYLRGVERLALIPRAVLGAYVGG